MKTITYCTLPITGVAVFSTVSLLQQDQCILFSVVFTPPTPSHHGSVWLLPVISLKLLIAQYCQQRALKIRRL
jgi:hypothetical protein